MQLSTLSTVPAEETTLLEQPKKSKARTGLVVAAAVASIVLGAFAAVSLGSTSTRPAGAALSDACSAPQGCCDPTQSDGSDSCELNQCAYDRFSGDCGACMCYSNTVTVGGLFCDGRGKQTVCMPKRSYYEHCNHAWQCTTGSCHSWYCGGWV